VAEDCREIAERLRPALKSARMPIMAWMEDYDIAGGEPKQDSLEGTSIYSDFECCGERRNCKLRFFHGVSCSSAYASAWAPVFGRGGGVRPSGGGHPFERR
jgi:hypothetical protein